MPELVGMAFSVNILAKYTKILIDKVWVITTLQTLLLRSLWIGELQIIGKGRVALRDVYHCWNWDL